MVNDSVLEGDEGRGKLRYNLGELQACVEPGVSEWGNPIRLITDHFVLNS